MTYATLTERERRIYHAVAPIMGCLCTIGVSMGVGALTWSFLAWLGLPVGVYGLAALAMAASTAMAVGPTLPMAVRRIVRGEW